MLWYELPIAPRLAIAAAYDQTPISYLSLPPRAHNALMRGRMYGSVGDVIRADSAISAVRNLGPWSLAEIDAAITPLLQQAQESQASEDDMLRSMASSLGVGAIWSRSRAAIEDLEHSHVSLWQLGWPRELRGLLSTRQITYLDDLTRVSADELIDDFGLGRRGLAELVERTDVAVEVLSDETHDWPRIWRAAGAIIRPERNNESVADMARLTLQEVVADFGDERIWTVISHRFGFHGAATYTLQEVGDALGVTRERIRQLQAIGLARVREWLEGPREYWSGERVWPDVAEAMLELEGLCRSLETAPLAEKDFVQLANKALSSSASRLEPAAALVCAAHGVRRLKPQSPMDSVFVRSGEDRRRLRALMKAVHDALTLRNPMPMTALELTMATNRERPAGDKITVGTVLRTVKCVSTVERLADGRCRGRFQYLRPRVTQVERLLAEGGEPMYAADIVRAMNRKLVALGLPIVHRANICNQMARSESFLPIGRSGLWALRRWPDVEAGTVLGLLERALVEANMPQTAAELHQYVSSRRPASSASVGTYLAGDDRFVRVPGHKWALARWSEGRDKARLDRLGVATLVAAHFRKRGQTSLPYPEVRQALMEKTGLELKVVTGLLATNPVITTRRNDAHELMAIMRANYRDLIDSESGRPPKGAVFQRLAKNVRRVLKAAPDGEMPLRELRNRLMAEDPSLAASTFYGYIRHMDDVETVRLPDRPGKLARLTGSD